MLRRVGVPLPCDSDASRGRFARVCAAFEQAWQVGPRREAWAEFAGLNIRLRVAGALLARHVEAPLAHLAVRRPPGAPDLEVELWDGGETGVGGLPPRLAEAAGERWPLEAGVFAASTDGGIVSHASAAGTYWFDRSARRIAGWVADARAVPLQDRARPLRILLALWASDRGVHAVHGAFVCRDGRGVLLPGDSGCGKSTAALRCLEAGFTFLGDDWIGIGRQREDQPVGYSLYASASLHPAQVERFPRLRAHAIAPQARGDLKSLVLLAGAFPGQIGRAASIAALLLPRLVDAADSGLQPASKRDALLTMARSSLFTMRPRGGRAALAALARLARELPAYWLELGSDLEQIPRRVDEALARSAS